MEEEPISLSGLEVAVVSMFGVFVSHQNAEGKLTKEEFLSMLKCELPGFAKDASVDTIRIFSGVDLNSDGFVDFREFAFMVCSFACGKHDMLQAAIKSMEQQKAKE